MKLPTEVLGDIVDTLPIGIILMDTDRVIHYMNESALVMTGWELGQPVPYCAYCGQRDIAEGENRCILTDEDPVPFFNSHMAVYSGVEEPFEMSLKKIMIDDSLFYILRLRRPVVNENSEKAKFHELLVHETIHAQEAERRKIARELHDHIGQSVYSIFLGLEAIKQFVNNHKYEAHLDNMIAVMEKTLDDIKGLTKNLRPDAVYHLGLKDALKEALRDWEKFYQIEIFIEAENLQDENIGQVAELNLFRIIQEAVNNAVRHGSASEINIKLKSSDGNIFFHIEDNGTGFEIERQKNNGLGLKHMYERCLMLNGDIRWTSTIGGPTKVEGFVSPGPQGGERNHEPSDS